MRTRALLERIRRGEVQNVRFADFVELLEDFGFERVRTWGSHRIYGHPAVLRPISLQPFRGRAKPYQIRQWLRIVEDYNLQPGASG